MTVEEHLLTFKKAGFISQRNLPRRRPESDGGREALRKSRFKKSPQCVRSTADRWLGPSEKAKIRL